MIILGTMFIYLVVGIAEEGVAYANFELWKQYVGEEIVVCAVKEWNVGEGRKEGGAGV